MGKVKRRYGHHYEPILLTDGQRKALEALLRRQSIEQSVARRARIILASSAEKGVGSIAAEVGVYREMVRIWIGRWKAAAAPLAQIESGGDEKALVKHIEEVLADNPRSGRPVTFCAEEVARIIAIACEDPSDSLRPVSHWTPREVADEAIRRGVVPSISVRQVGRFLK
jgi:putative transposase